MKNEATDSLKHLTIFEDASYIASKKLLELSKLSSYLEDIALLLRGKGEALITLTTTLDISKNIVLNSGSKFFFKYNEKSEDVVHYIGINKNSRFNVNNLSIGYCIAKIDSIAKPFLLKCETKKKYYFSRNFKKKKPELIHFDTNKELGKIQDEKTIISPREIDPKKNTPDKNYYEEIVPDSSQKISGLNFDFKKAFENLEEFYLINEFSNCAKFIIQIYSEIINLECKEPKLNFENKEKYFLKVLSNKIKWNIQHMMKFIKIFHSIKQKFENNNSTYTSEEIQECIHRLKTLYKIFIKTNQLNNYNKNIQQHINYDNTDKKINQVESEIVQIPINLIVYFFNEIIGPEEFYFIGKTKILDKKQEILTKYMDFGVGLYETIYDSYHYLISTFELSSNWARGGHELVQIVIYLRQNQSSQQILASISKELISLTEKIKPNKEIFQGLYISRLKAHTNFKNEIIHQNFILKAKLKQFHSKLNTLKFGELTINDNIEENFDSNYIKLVNLINSLIIKEQN